MPIVIQELLASDTLSQAVDKINFNFDQLLLNGGGPVGPLGPAGPTGPIGGRGIRGSVWYEDTTGSPGTDPNQLVILGLNEGDNFLQSNGQVWVYNGTVWVQTVINLTGPQGVAGLAAGFNYIGGFPTGNVLFGRQNVAFPIPMPSGVSGGAQQGTNQGITTVLLGAVGSTQNPPSGINYTSAFRLPDAISAQLDASLVSVMVHQKDAGSSSIVFMGGGDVPSEKYEQTTLANLSNITLGTDDQLIVNVPKSSTLPQSQSDLIGFTVNTLKRGQQYYAGKQINFISGADLTPSGFGSEISDISFTVNSSNPSILAKFSVGTTSLNASGLFQLGGDIILTQSTTRTGRALLDTGEIRLTAVQDIRFNIGGNKIISIDPTRALILHPILNQITTADLSGPNAALIEVGALGSVLMPDSTNRGGDVRVEAGQVRLIASSNIRLTRNVNQYMGVFPGSFEIRHDDNIRIENLGFQTALIQIGNVPNVLLDTTRTGTIRIEAGLSSIVGNTVRLSKNSTNFIRIDAAGIRLQSDVEAIIDAKLKLLQVNASTGNPQVLVRNSATNEIERLSGLPFIPIGVIVMWSGNPNSLPVGWALCNGQQQNNMQTPDLRGRFIVGYNPSDPDYSTVGNIGGSKQVTLTIPQMPQHSHLMVAPEATGQGPADPIGLRALRLAIGRSGNTSYKLAGSSLPHNEGKTSDTGGNQPHENRPPYYTLAFIMYVGTP